MSARRRTLQRPLSGGLEQAATAPSESKRARAWETAVEPAAATNTAATATGGETVPLTQPAPQFSAYDLALQEALGPRFDPTRALLRRLFFLNAEKTRYVSVAFYPGRNYQVMVEFGGPRIRSLALTEQHVTTMAGCLPKLCDSMREGESYTCKDDAFRLATTGMNTAARLYLNKQYVGFRLVDLQYLRDIFHVVQQQLARYLHAQPDVVSYATLALASVDYLAPAATASPFVHYDRLFEELKNDIL